MISDLISIFKRNPKPSQGPKKSNTEPLVFPSNSLEEFKPIKKFDRNKWIELMARQAKTKDSLPFFPPNLDAMDISLATLLKCNKSIIVFSKMEDWESKLPVFKLGLEKTDIKIAEIKTLRIPEGWDGLSELKFLVIGGDMIGMILSKKNKEDEYVMSFSWADIIKTIYAAQSSNTSLIKVEGRPLNNSKKFEKQPVKVVPKIEKL